jgi:hypothetical protein
LKELHRRPDRADGRAQLVAKCGEERVLGAVRRLRLGARLLALQRIGQ